MIITCDQIAQMGYVYIKKPDGNRLIWKKCNDSNKIYRYLDRDDINIPIYMPSLYTQKISKDLLLLSIETREYNKLLNNYFIEEYENDKDKSGYIEGIEFSFNKEIFINNIKSKCYRIYHITFKEKNSILLTLDREEVVLNNKNLIVPATSKNDTFYIIHINNQIGYITGIIYNKISVDELEYLKSPSFVLFE